MFYAPEFLDEVRARVGLADVVGRRVKLIKRGREYVALCPFHKEKTPSFTLNEEKGFYHCFGCGAHGDVFKYLTESEGVSFGEAVARLAGQAGLALPEAKPGDREKAEKAKTQYTVLEEAAAWFTAQLNGEAGKAARAYVEGRGIDGELAARFRLGLAPDSGNRLKQALMAKKYPESLLVEAGLLIRPEDGSDTFDRFRNRLMFPIADRRGQVVAFGGRALGEARAKYLNSPESEVFHKGSLLYNLHQATPAIRTGGSVVVVEGYMDVIALAGVGIDGAVAPMGTAITERQIEILWRLAPEPVLCFDGDEAGQKAADRAAERTLPLLKPGHSLAFAVLPRGEDPDSLVRNKGRGPMDKLLARPQQLWARLWEMLRRGRNLDTPERQAGLEADIDRLTAQITDGKVRGTYRSSLRGLYFEVIRGRGRGARGKKSAANQKVGAKTGATREFRAAGPLADDDAGRRECVLVGIMIGHPELLARYQEDFAALDFSILELDKLRNEIIGITTNKPDVDNEGLKHQLIDEGLSDTLERLAISAAPGTEWFTSPDAATEDTEKAWISVLARHRLPGLRAHLAEVTDVYAADITKENHERLKSLLAEIESAEAEADAGWENFGVTSGRRAPG